MDPGNDTDLNQPSLPTPESENALPDRTTRGFLPFQQPDGNTAPPAHVLSDLSADPNTQRTTEDVNYYPSEVVINESPFNDDSLETVEADNALPSINPDIPKELSETAHPKSFRHLQCNVGRKDFERDLLDATRGGLLKAPKYTSVHVLLIQWEDDDLGVHVELNAMETVFCDRFKFCIERFYIPTENSRRKLQARIVQFDGDFPAITNLLIVYYNGHAYNDNDDMCHWHPTKHNCIGDGVTFQWNAIQGILEEAPQDVLFILDCCYAGAAATKKGQRATKELLAACGRETWTPGVGPDSLTSRIVAALESLPGPIVPISWLYSTIVRSSDLKKTPIHVLLTQSHQTIALTPVPPAALLAPAPDMSRNNSTGNTADTQEAQSSVFSTGLGSADGQTQLTSADPSSGGSSGRWEHRAVITVRLREDINLDSQEWETWLRDKSPDEVIELESIRIECEFASNSTLLVVSMPVHIWTLLPDNPAYAFVGFVKSPNHLPTQIGHNISSEMFPGESDIAKVPPTGTKKDVLHTIYENPSSWFSEILRMYEKYERGGLGSSSVPTASKVIHDMAAFIHMRPRLKKEPAWQAMQLAYERTESFRSGEGEYAGFFNGESKFDTRFQNAIDELFKSVVPPSHGNSKPFLVDLRIIQVHIDEIKRNLVTFMKAEAAKLLVESSISEIKSSQRKLSTRDRYRMLLTGQVPWQLQHRESSILRKPAN